MKQTEHIQPLWAVSFVKKSGTHSCLKSTFCRLFICWSTYIPFKAALGRLLRAGFSPRLIYSCFIRQFTWNYLHIFIRCLFALALSISQIRRKRRTIQHVRITKAIHIFCCSNLHVVSYHIISYFTYIFIYTYLSAKDELDQPYSG